MAEHDLRLSHQATVAHDAGTMLHARLPLHGAGLDRPDGGN